MLLVEEYTSLYQSIVLCPKECPKELVVQPLPNIIDFLRLTRRSSDFKANSAQ